MLIIAAAWAVGFAGMSSCTVSPLQAADPPLLVGAWKDTGNLNIGRMWHTATRLNSGKVLVVGGVDNKFALVPAAELYDPATGIWTSTGSLKTARYYHTATLLSDGKVLVAGGRNYSDTLASAEIYNPDTGTWTNTGSLTPVREMHTATPLSDGRVLVAGGIGGDENNFGHLSSAELYNPATGTWTGAGSLSTVRFGPTATRLLNGKVLVTGGGTMKTWPVPSSIALPRGLGRRQVLSQQVE
jgi:N-acetylneuraminic acid mutarotase